MMTKREITQLSYDITGCTIKVHKKLGPGLLESIYERCLKYELTEKGFYVEQQVLVPVEYGDLKFDVNLRLDLLVNDAIIVELKMYMRLNCYHI